MMELEILLTLKNNKVVPIRKVPELFDHNWDRYRAKFNELMIKRYFKISTQIPGICNFELNKKADDRIAALVTDRAREIKIKLSRLNENRYRKTLSGRATLSGILNLIKGFANHSTQTKSA